MFVLCRHPGWVILQHSVLVGGRHCSKKALLLKLLQCMRHWQRMLKKDMKKNYLHFFGTGNLNISQLEASQWD